MAKLDEKGHEILDPTPVAKPVRALRRPSTLDEIRHYIGIVNREAEEQGQESFEEADDFEVGDDYDPTSPWEMTIDQEQQWAEFRAYLRERKAQAEAGRRAGQAPPAAAAAPPAVQQENPGTDPAVTSGTAVKADKK